MLLISLICIWLTVCAVQDYQYRQVSNWLTIPTVAIALIYRLSLFSPSFIVLLVFVSWLLYLIWQKRWLGGADFKAALALLLFDPGLLLWASCAILFCYFFWSILKRTEAVKTMPAFGGFMLGSYGYLLARIIYG